MGFEYIGPFPDPDQSPPNTGSEPGNTQSAMFQASPNGSQRIGQPPSYVEPDYREHVSGQLKQPFYPQAPPQQGQPAMWGQPSVALPYGQQPYAGQSGITPPHTAPYYPPYAQGYPPYAQGYPGYYTWAPPKPKRDVYQLTISIIAFVCSCLTCIAGIITGFILLLITLVPTSSLQADKLFGGQVMFTALTTAGLIGGGFSVYHSTKALFFFKKPSAQFKLPWFWIFFVLYIGVLISAAVLSNNGFNVANVPAPTTFFIALAGILPALTFLSLGVRRVHYPKESRWPTTWRRITLAIVSGATLGTVLAIIFELILSLVVTASFGLNGFNLDDPNMAVPHDPTQIALLLSLVSVIAPLVEEAVKPLAVVALIGRVRSAAEAFVLGMACGIGFDLIETSGYISQGYKDWLDVAIQRSTAGLLHGFGAGMVALGWYFLTHRNSTKYNRILLGLGCGLYAVVQHAIWNGSFLVQLLPDPVGPYLDHGMVTLGLISFQAVLLTYLFESLLMLTFFVFVTGQLRGKIDKPPFWKRIRKPSLDPGVAKLA